MAILLHHDAWPGWRVHRIVVRRWRPWYRVVNHITTGIARTLRVHCDFYIDCPTECPCCGQKMP